MSEGSCNFLKNYFFFFLFFFSVGGFVSCVSFLSIFSLGVLSALLAEVQVTLLFVSVFSSKPFLLWFNSMYSHWLAFKICCSVLTCAAQVI